MRSKQNDSVLSLLIDLTVWLFQPPRPHRGWQLIQAVDYGPSCPQPTRFTGATKGVRDMDEDCLYLNVFSPTVSIIISKQNKSHVERPLTNKNLFHSAGFW